MYVLPQDIPDTLTTDCLKINDIVFLRTQTFDAQQIREIEISTNLMAVILHGKCIVHLKPDSIKVLPNEYIFCKRGELITCEEILSEQGKYEVCMLFFDDALLEAFLDSHPYITSEILKRSSADFNYFSGTVDRPFQEALQSILSLFKHPINHQSEILQLKFNEILIYLLDSENGESFHSFLKSMLDKNNHAFSQFMYKNFDRPLNIEDYSRSLNMSSSAFNKRFKSIFKQPPKTWINEKRLERSAQLLSQPNISITDICEQTGFRSVSHFISLFKQRFGITPKQYQKQRTKY